MHGTTNIAFFVEGGGIIFAVDSRSTSRIEEKESHKFYDKVHQFNENLFATKCGASSLAINQMFSELVQVQNPSLESIAEEAYEFMKKVPEVKLATLVVGYDGQTPKIYSVRANGIKDIDLYASIGSGAESASGVLKKHCKHGMPVDNGILVAQDAMTEASLTDRCTGNWICINRLYFDGECGVRVETREGVLRNYLTRFEYHQSFTEEESETSKEKAKSEKEKGKISKEKNRIKIEDTNKNIKVNKPRQEKSALYVLVHSSVDMSPESMRKIFDNYGKPKVEASHCLGLFGTPTDVGYGIPPWTNNFHFHRIQFEDAGVADDVYALVKQRYEIVKDEISIVAILGDIDATYMSIVKKTDMAAIVCKESKGMLDFIMKYHPESWKSNAEKFKRWN